MQQRAFSTPARACDRHEFVRRDLERNVIKSEHAIAVIRVGTSHVMETDHFNKVAATPSSQRVRGRTIEWAPFRATRASPDTFCDEASQPHLPARICIVTDQTVQIATARLNAQIEVIFEAADFIVVNKPAFLLVHPSKPDGAPTLWNALQKMLSFELVNGGQVSIINRLDRETSGLTLVCKNAKAARHFSILMEHRRIAKEYLAIVWGWPDEDEFEIDLPIARQGAHEPSAIWLKQKIHPGGASARTFVMVEKRFERPSSNGHLFALVRATPITGRMHQIRVHLSSAGHPVVGDKIYGPDEGHYLRFIETGWTPELEKSLLLPRHALHSAALSVEGQRWESALPPDLHAWMNPEEIQLTDFGDQTC
jgi:23S rRNA pseudouridine1911/1915/1917 synthase